VKTQRLGANGPAISTIGLGLMGMSEFYGSSEDSRSIAVIHRALELGINFFSTRLMSMAAGRTRSWSAGR
jgi:aryl-alcohol dehydrogenase-like predicted oxidoreductase